MIYADAAAGEPVRPEVAQAMGAHLGSANPSSLHDLGKSAAEVLSNARGLVSYVLGWGEDGYEVDPTRGIESNRVAFTGGGTWSNNIAILGLVRRAWERDPSQKIGIVTSCIEHSSVLSPIRELDKDPRVTVAYAKNTAEGLITPGAVEAALTQVNEEGYRPYLVTIQLANNEVGTLQPITLISAIAHQYGAIIHCDAVAAALSESLSMERLAVDSLAVSPHKVGGPRGIGVLALRRYITPVPLGFGGDQEGGLWPGTVDVASAVGAAVALNLAHSERFETRRRLTTVRNVLIESSLADHDNLSLTGPSLDSPVKRLPSLASFMLSDRVADSVLADMSVAGVHASAGAACGARDEGGSEVLEALGYVDAASKRGLRFSFAHDATEDDARQCARALTSVLMNK